MQGREVCFVQHIPFSVPCSYELAVQAGACSWTGIFALFPALLDRICLRWEVAGSFMSLDFSITQGDKLIARIEKAWPAFQDRYSA